MFKGAFSSPVFLLGKVWIYSPAEKPVLIEPIGKHFCGILYTVVRVATRLEHIQSMNCYHELIFFSSIFVEVWWMLVETSL